MNEETIIKAEGLKNDLLKVVEHLNSVSIKAREMGAELKQIPEISALISYDHTNDAFTLNKTIYERVLSAAFSGNKTIGEQVRAAALMNRIAEREQTIIESAIRGL